MAGAFVVAATATPLCPTALFFGVPCPGCGLTRATLALLHGHVREALHFHPLVLVLTPLFVAALGKALLDYVRGPQAAPRAPTWWTGRTMLLVASLLLALTLGVWLARFAGYFGGPVAVTPWWAS